jgi:hypothetical protein
MPIRVSDTGNIPPTGRTWIAAASYGPDSDVDAIVGVYSSDRNTRLNRVVLNQIGL